jgi:hypothetical protein
MAEDRDEYRNENTHPSGKDKFHPILVSKRDLAMYGSRAVLSKQSTCPCIPCPLCGVSPGLSSRGVQHRNFQSNGLILLHSDGV